VNKAVFLDRDGVLTRANVWDGKPYAPRSLTDLEILPDARAATTALKTDGFRLVVITNQPDVGNGLLDMTVVEAMHCRLRDELPINMIKACYHRQSDGCYCRKPRPGMLIEAAEELEVDLARSFVVGDRWSDVEAGRSQGCRTVFVDRGYSEPRFSNASAIVSSVAEAAAWILRAKRISGEANSLIP
jgi:D-glycero-D-manno-heptose 1,7-bisphosphate phosphatase